MSGNFTKTLFLCLLLILTNISANADSPKIRWSNTNKTIAPEMIQVSEDGNYLHTLQNNYYKKIDLNTGSIVKVVDLKQVCIKTIQKYTNYLGWGLSIDPIFDFNYPNITLIFRASVIQYILYYNIETEESKFINHDYGITSITSNENYTIMYYFNIVGSKEGSFRSTHIFLWDYNKDSVRKIFLSNSDKSIASAAGLYENDKYWTYTGPGGLRLYNAENDSLLNNGFAGIDTYFNAYYKEEDDEVYFLTYSYAPTCKKINLKSMKSESYEIPNLPSLANPQMNLRYKNYIGYSSLYEKPIMVIYDLKSNSIINISEESSYYRAFDIDKTKDILYYITENNPGKIFCKNLKDSTIDRIISFNLPKTNFKIGKEIIANYNFYSNSYGISSKLFSNYSLLNKESGSELSFFRIDTLNLRNTYGNFFYDSLTNKYYPVYYNGSNYITFDYQTREIINNSVKDTIIPYYYIPSGVYYSSKILNTIDILNGNITDKIDFIYSEYSLLAISRNGRQIWMKNTDDYKNYYFYDLNEKQEYKYPWYNYSANYIALIGNSGNFITQNGKQVILRNFKEPQDSITLGTTNSLITTSTFSNNERMIITGDVTGKIMFWNLLTNSKSNELDLNMDIKKIDLTLDETGLLVLTGDGSLTMIDVEDILITDVKEKDNITSDISISPNPAVDYITINIQPSESFNPSQGSVVEIFDILGVKVISEPIHPMTSSHRMNIENLTNGAYFIKIGERVEKFVKM